MNNQSYTLNDFKSKVILLDFTSVTCGPCQMSIPFLEHISKMFEKQTFQVISIEVHTKNPQVLKNYKQRNDFHYQFFMSDKETRNNYNVHSVPVFFILDENRIIKKIIYGYQKGEIDKKIINAIKELI